MRHQFACGCLIELKPAIYRCKEHRLSTDMIEAVHGLLEIQEKDLTKEEQERRIIYAKETIAKLGV